MTGVVVRGEETQRMLCDDGCKDRSEASTSQGMPKSARNHQRSWKSRGRVLAWGLQREHSPTKTLIFNLKTPGLRESTFLQF